ncbi:MAG: presenilin family intramembrane aspartyl protease [Candidatus Thermoplasmatota archaeon]|nr:presenilin family intramembrane aspartyl protease [Candidatus Thermoplasmatota archaeon]
MPGGEKAPSSTSGFGYIIYYLVAAIVFSAIVIFLGRRDRARIIRYFFIGVTAFVIFYVFSILGLYIANTLAEYYAISIIPALFFAALMLMFEKWYITNIVGFLLTAGVASIWSEVIGIWASVVFLAVFAVYDYISVYRTKHMISLAKVSVQQRLPMLFFYPTKKGAQVGDMSFEPRNDDSRGDVIALGFGDMVFPAIMVVSSSLYQPTHLLLFAMLPLLGAVVGMIILFFFVSSRPAPGLPLINSGAIGGFLIAFAIFTLH